MGAQLLWFKATARFYAPSAALAVQMSTAMAGQPASSYKYVVTPWLAGHAVLWTAASLISKVRGAARVSITKSQMAHLGKMDESKLKEVFNKYGESRDFLSFFKNEYANFCKPDSGETSPFTVGPLSPTATLATTFPAASAIASPSLHLTTTLPPWTRHVR